MSTSTIPCIVPATRVVHIPVEYGSLVAELAVPTDPLGVILFARTNASPREPRHDQQLASSLHDARFATLIFDLLTPREELLDEPIRGMRVDLALLARRLIESIDWLADEPETFGLDVGLFGEGPGAAAAFVAACVRSRRTRAIVSYAARLDPASPVLSRVRAPSLIMLSGEDEADLESNEAAFRRLTCPKQLVHVAMDRFTTSGETNREISRLACDWFSRTMTPVREGLESAARC